MTGSGTFILIEEKVLRKKAEASFLWRWWLRNQKQHFVTAGKHRNVDATQGQEWERPRKDHDFR